MATEYLKTGDFNIKSNVWSYGVVLWEIFTVGNRPYGINPNFEDEKMKIPGGERLPLPGLADLIPHGRDVYEKVMLPCWNDEARQRPEFSTIVSQLAEFLGQEEGKVEAVVDLQVENPEASNIEGMMSRKGKLNKKKR